MTPLSTTLQFNVKKSVQDGDHNLYERTLYIYFLILGLYVSDRLENCTIFGTTIFFDQRKNAPIGENGFFKTILSFSLSYSRFFKH